MFIARSANDRTDDWPFWYVRRDSSNLNVTREAIQIAKVPTVNPCGVFMCQSDAILLAKLANKAEGHDGDIASR